MINEMTGAELQKAIQICPLSKEDEGITAEFFASLQGETRFYFNCNRMNEKCAAAVFSGKREHTDLFAALMDGKMIGYLFLWDMDSLPGLGICVLDEYQGMGVGSMLMEYAEHYARKHHKNGILLTVHPANVKAQALYRKMKYQYLGTDRNGEFIFIRRLNEKQQQN